MDAKDLANWMREEHQHVEELSATLREKLVSYSRGSRRPWLIESRDTFERFREHFGRHIALEEDDGYLEAVLERQPGTAAQVERLKQEHQQMIRIMDSIHTAMQELQHDNDLQIRDCCVRIKNLLCAIDQHEQDENMIVSLVFNHDMGVDH